MRIAPRKDSQATSIGAAVPAFGGLRASFAGGPTLSKDDVQSALLGWWRELLLLDRIDLEDDFFTLGGDSLAGAQLLGKIKETFGVDLRLSILFDCRTVRQLGEVIGQNYLSQDAGSEPWCTLLPLQPAGSRAPLFWIPGGNGTSVLLFKEISLLLGSDQPSYGVEAKMPEPDQEFESIPDRAKRFIKEVRALQPNGPYSLIGFCGGGYVAFEMAQQLSADGHDVGFLAIVECADDRHPKSVSGKLRMRAERVVWRLKQLFGRGTIGIARWAVQRVQSTASDVHLRAKRLEARMLGGPIPPLPAGSLDIYEKARRIVDRYHPTSYRGKSLVLVSEDTYQYSGLSSAVDPRLFWCELCEGGSEVRRIPGDHTDILKEPLVDRFAQELKHGLERSTR